MALFSTLVSSTNDGDASSSLSSIPTVIQLYTSDDALILDPTAKTGEHAILSYQAVEVGGTLGEEEGALFGHKRKVTKAINQNPNLGIWNCCVPKSQKDGSLSSLVDQLLGVPKSGDSSTTFCFTVNLKDPSTVERAVASLQEALVRHLIQSPPSQTAATLLPTTATTSLYQLRLAQFGLAPEDDKSKEPTLPDENDKKIMVPLMICAVVPPTSTFEGKDAYKEKQAQALLLYHLRRYAASLKATLCLVRTRDETPQGADQEEKEGEPMEQPTMNVNEVAHAWLNLARGEPLFKEEANTLEETKENEETTAAYGPGTQEDLIETVLLRNASCQGEWDASKDNLWVALPPMKSSSDNATSSTNKAGDEVWLSQLRESLGSLLTATEKAAAATTATEDSDRNPQEKKEDAEVSSFFENLLKKG